MSVGLHLLGSASLGHDGDMTLETSRDTAGSMTGLLPSDLAWSSVLVAPVWPRAHYMNWT